MKKTITDPQLGEITLRRVRNVRRISLSVRQPGRITLTFPYGCSSREALSFLETKRDWLMAALHRMEERSAVRILEPGYRTRNHGLEFLPSSVDKISSRINNGRITVTHPASLPSDSPKVQQAARDAVIKTFRAEAKEYLPGRVESLARQTGLNYRSVTVRATTSRWGSCSGRDDISLSLFLMKLPDHLIDYIIIHELCHTVHKNHSSQFHALVDKILRGKEKGFIREMKSYRPDIF